MRQPSRRFQHFIIAVVGLLTIAKIWFASNAELLPEEAYYWTYSQHPALSYFDHPPMVAWTVTLGTAIFGNTELGVRFTIVLLSLVSSVLMFLTGRLWFGSRVAWWAVLLFNTIPIFIATGVLTFPDGPLLFFWLLTLYAISKVVMFAPPTDPKFRFGSAAGYWLLAGAAFGGAMLSKYTAVLLAPSLVLFLFFSSSYRAWLRRPEPWIAAFTAALIFSPVIIWNAQHQWASFQFQSTRTMGQQINLLKTVGGFWGVQVVILSPFLFLLLGVTAVRAIKRGWVGREEKWNFAISFFLPLFLLFVVASITTKIHVNWTAPAFLSLIPAAAALFSEALETANPKNALRLRIAAWITAACSIAAIMIACTTLVWGIPKFLTYSHAGGWRDLANQVKVAEKELQQSTGKKPFVLGMDKYNTSAEIGFYQNAPETQVNECALGKPGIGYRYWTDLEAHKGYPAVAVLLKPDPLAVDELREHFDRVDPPREIKNAGPGQRDRTAWFVFCFGYHSPKSKLAQTQ